MTVTLSGSGFSPGAVVRWNSSPLATGFLSSTQLTATVTSALIVSPGTAGISVVNPDGGTSSPVVFSVGNAGAAISGLSPASVAAGGVGFTLKLTGSGFVQGAVVEWNGSGLPSSWISTTQLGAFVSSSLIMTSAAIRIAIINVGGGLSNTVVFMVTSAANPSASAASVSAGPIPIVEINGVRNAASLLGSIAPGSIISVFGTDLAASITASSESPALTGLGGASVTINGRSAPMMFASPTQINAQVPFETVAGPARLIVETHGVRSEVASFEVTATAPGVFVDAGTERAIAENYPAGTMNSALSPVPSRGCAVIYLTGQGSFEPPVQTAALGGTDTTSVPRADVEATIGGEPARVVSARPSPGLLGVMLMILQLPDLEAGGQLMEITVGGVKANRAFLTVGPVESPLSASEGCAR